MDKFGREPELGDIEDGNDGDLEIRRLNHTKPLGTLRVLAAGVLCAAATSNTRTRHWS